MIGDWSGGPAADWGKWYGKEAAYDWRKVSQVREELSTSSESRAFAAGVGSALISLESRLRLPGD